MRTDSTGAPCFGCGCRPDACTCRAFNPRVLPVAAATVSGGAAVTGKPSGKSATYVGRGREP